MSELLGGNETLDISNIQYEEALAQYLDLAYKTLKSGGKKVPAESRMRIPLSVLFVLHNRDIFGYTTVKGFAKIAAEVAKTKESSILDRVLGPYIGGDYAGLKYIFYRYVPYNNTHALSVQWNCSKKSWRYNYLVQVEELVSKAMEREANKTGVDTSVLRIKV